VLPEETTLREMCARHIPLKETMMSKRQHGNKEAKKPKKARAPIQPAAPRGSTPLGPAAVPPQFKR
jgi:hypothetical protein